MCVKATEKLVDEKPTMSLDYMFMHSQKEEDPSQEKSTGMDTSPILVMIDHQTTFGFSSVVPSKGVNPYAVHRLNEDLNFLGHRSINLKSDGESSIKALKEAVRARVAGTIEVNSSESEPGQPEELAQVIVEESAAYDSKSNGRVESYGKRVQGIIRSMKDGLEFRLGERIEAEHMLLAWLVQHASWCLNRFKVGSDGKTAFERLKGKKFGGKVAEFGERVMYLKPGQKGHHKLECRWEEGIWLGMRNISYEHYIGTPEGCVKVRDIRRFGHKRDQWNLELVNKVKGLPWEPIPGQGLGEIKSKISIAPLSEKIEGSEAREPKEFPVRSFPIHKSDFINVGYTPMCLGCRALAQGRARQKHSDVCRSRVEAELMRTGDPRVVRAYERAHEHFTKVEEGKSQEVKTAKREREEESVENGDQSKRRREEEVEMEQSAEESGVKRELGREDEGVIQAEEEQEEPRSSKSRRVEVSEISRKSVVKDMSDGDWEKALEMCVGKRALVITCQKPCYLMSQDWQR